jgi:hypothetical protein
MYCQTNGMGLLTTLCTAGNHGLTSARSGNAEQSKQSMLALLGLVFKDSETSDFRA